MQQESCDYLLNKLAAQEAEIHQLKQELLQVKEDSKTCFEKVQMTSWQKELLSDFFESSADCFIHFDQLENCAILMGKCENVRTFQFELLKELNSLKVTHLVLTPAMKYILSKELGKQYLEHLNSFQLNEAQVSLQNNVLLVAAKNDDKLNIFMEFLETVMNYKETVKFDVKIPLEKLYLLQSTLEQRLLVSCSFSDTAVCVEGLKNDVMESYLEIKQFVMNVMNNKIKQSLSEENDEFKKTRQENQDELQNEHANITKLEEDNELNKKSLSVTELHASCIHNNCQKHVTHERSVNSTPTEVPRRGTLEFLRHVAESVQHIPSYWNLNSSNNSNRSLRLPAKFDILKSEERSLLVDVDIKTKDTITKLITTTWTRTSTSNTTQKIKVIDVKRVENLQLFKLYLAKRQLLINKICAGTNVCEEVGNLEGSRGEIVTTEELADFMKEELYYEINEHYLFHGTQFPAVVCSTGIDPQVSSEGGSFGEGIYTAEKFEKSDEHADTSFMDHRSERVLTMVLARVLLGNVFVYTGEDKSTDEKITGPPCMACQEDTCDCDEPTLYDSVMGDEDSELREFVVYERDQFYPEYLIYYQKMCP